MNMIQFVGGLALLGWGRSLFWLFVAWLGFIIGFQVAHDVFGTTEFVTLAIALALGLMGALFALLLKDLAIGIAGFLAGGLLAYTISIAFIPQFALMLGILGGVIGWLAMYAVFDIAVILLTSLVGASLITQNLTLSQVTTGVLYVALVFAGILMQSRSRRRSEVAEVHVVHHYQPQAKLK